MISIKSLIIGIHQKSSNFTFNKPHKWSFEDDKKNNGDKK